MLEHFKKSDQEFIIKAKDWIKQVYYKQKVKVTNFLNPHEQHILRTLVNQQEDIEISFDGGFINAERNRAIIYPSYLNDDDHQTRVEGFRIKYNRKFLTPEHRQILGSLMALKIERAVIGDIVFQENGEIYFAICEEFSSFIIDNFTMIGRDSISLIQTNLQVIEKRDQLEEFEIIVSSMRLDVIVASLMNASRSHVHEYITQGFVQLNHSGEKNHSHICHFGDAISIKRYGRFRLIGQKKTTRNNKLVIVVGKAI